MALRAIKIYYNYLYNFDTLTIFIKDLYLTQKLYYYFHINLFILLDDEVMTYGSTLHVCMDGTEKNGRPYI